MLQASTSQGLLAFIHMEEVSVLIHDAPAVVLSVVLCSQEVPVYLMGDHKREPTLRKCEFLLSSKTHLVFFHLL